MENPSNTEPTCPINNLAPWHFFFVYTTWLMYNDEIEPEYYRSILFANIAKVMIFLIWSLHYFPSVYSIVHIKPLWLQEHRGRKSKEGGGGGDWEEEGQKQKMRKMTRNVTKRWKRPDGWRQLGD